MADSELIQCSVSVSDRNSRASYQYPCKNPTKVEIDGKWYCGTHDPVKVQERRDKRNELYNAEYETRTDKFKSDTAIVQV